MMQRKPPYGGEEPIEQLLADPIIDQILKRDGLSRADLEGTISFLRRITVAGTIACDEHRDTLESELDYHGGSLVGALRH